MFLGIDIGGTTLSLGLVDGNTLVKSMTAPSFAANATLQDTYGYLESLIEKIITPEVNLIGIGVPSVVDANKGIVYNAVNIPSWKEAHLGEVLSDYFKIPVKINNDANCFSLGAAAKVAPDAEIVVGVTLGTGVGTGLVVDGKIINGRHTGVGEIGSIMYRGRTLEEFCAKTFFTEKGLDSKEVNRKAVAGDPEALAVFDEFGKNLGDLLSIVVFAYDPSVVVFGGGIANNHNLFEKAMMQRLQEVVPYTEILKSLRIEYMPDPEIPIIGASLL